jgi:3-oxoacyl-[acyl-carrier protein] reductase/2-hydroxycyclohexanecarboxyl-CoA dehydrogenase
MRLQGKVAAVTGAGRGIGKGIATKLAQEGACLVVNDVSPQVLEALIAELQGSGTQMLAVAGRVDQRADAERIVQTAIEQLGQLDILVNNAGINRDAMLHKMTDEQWQDVIAVDLTGVFYCTRAAGAYMRQRGSGRIINISSGSWLGNIGQANYAAAKAGVVGLSKTAARELAGKGVTVNAICPGFIDTDMTRGIPENIRAQVVHRIPMGRAGAPSDVANLVAFLASDEAAYITGEVINVAGGYIV